MTSTFHIEINRQTARKEDRQPVSLDMRALHGMAIFTILFASPSAGVGCRIYGYAGPPPLLQITNRYVYVLCGVGNRIRSGKAVAGGCVAIEEEFGVV